MKDPEDRLISVIVPAFNAEKYISRCVGSILAQSHRHLEVIVVDDCSTDGTGAVLDRLAAKDKRLIVVHGAENRGVHGARRAGLELAKGSCIGFVDGDDWIARGMYEKLLEAFLAEDADIAICGAMGATGVGEITKPKVRFRKRYVAAKRLMERFCAIEFGSGVLWNKLYRAELIRSHGSLALERDVDAAEDYIVNFGVFSAARRVVALPGCDYYYFESPETASRRESKAKSFCRILRAYVVCLEFHGKKGPEAVAEIDRLYTHQLKMKVYQVDAASDLTPFAAELEETMSRLARVHPAGLHSLTHAFDPGMASYGTGVRGYSRRVLAAFRAFGKAFRGIRRSDPTARARSARAEPAARMPEDVASRQGAVAKENAAEPSPVPRQAPISGALDKRRVRVPGKKAFTISVVIPCHNCGRFITEALDSVARQTRRPDEVIVVVDSSSDESEAAARRHPLKPEVLTVEFGNAGKARNLGVSSCRSEWVAFLDADDWWTDTHLEEAERILLSGDDVAYMGHYSEFWQESGETLEKTPLFEGSAKSGLTSEVFYRHFLGENSGWTTPAMVVNCARFLEVGGFDPVQVRRHDAEMFSRVVFGRTWAYNPAVVFHYRKDVEGAISNDRAECSYYRFLADLKISELYGFEQGLPNIRDRAKTCMSEALRCRTNPGLFESAASVCLPYLDPGRHLVYRAAALAPAFSRWILVAGSMVKNVVKGGRGSSGNGRPRPVESA